jgi:GTP-binding protein HflX
VWNKVDRLEPHPGDVLLSATQRESTRELLVRVAEALASRWDEAAKGPALVPEEVRSARELPDVGDEGAVDEGGDLSTVEDMLRAANRRVRKAPRPS